MPTKLYHHLRDIETRREAIENDLLKMESLKHEAGLLYARLQEHATALIDLFRAEKSHYLLEQVLRFRALLHRSRESFGYDERIFRVFFRHLEKVVNYSRDELVSPLILPNLKRQVEREVRRRMLAPRPFFWHFVSGGTHLLTPPLRCRFVQGIEPDRPVKVRYHGEDYHLPPLAQTAIGRLPGAEVKALLLLGQKAVYPFYIESGLRRFIMRTEKLRSRLQPTSTPIAGCAGFIRYRGNNLYYMQLE